METIQITRIRENHKEVVEDRLAEEIPLTLLIGDKELVTLSCSPFDLEDLVRGFLFTSGLIKTARQIRKIVLDRQKWSAHVKLAGKNIREGMIFKRLYTSGCGRGTLFYNVYDILHRQPVTSGFRIRKTALDALMADFRKRSRLYLSTGSVHGAAVADDKNILVFREDIGRHNAVDKVIGNLIQQGISFRDKIMITSGRISSEILFKTQKCRIPLVISRGSPTNQAVRLARETTITLVGFARGRRMNVYSGEERVTI